MSEKSNVQSETPNVSWGEAYVLTTNTPDRLSGRIFSVIETMGLKDKQEESAKDIIRTIIWEIFEDAIYISAEKHNEIRKAFYEQRAKVALSEEPISAV